MNPIETLKYHNEWRRGSDTEMLNPTKLGKAIDTVIADYEALQKQNDELRANNESLRSALDKALELARQDFSCSEGFYKYIKEKLESTPAQSLADIRAEAVTQFTEHVKYTFEGIMSDDALIDFGNEYIANRIKEG